MFPGRSKIGERREEIVGGKSRGKSRANEEINAIHRERKRFRHSETLPKNANTRFVVYLEHPSSPSTISRHSNLTIVFNAEQLNLRDIFSVQRRE